MIFLWSFNKLNWQLITWQNLSYENSNWWNNPPTKFKVYVWFAAGHFFDSSRQIPSSIKPNNSNAFEKRQKHQRDSGRIIIHQFEHVDSILNSNSNEFQKNFHWIIFKSVADHYRRNHWNSNQERKDAHKQDHEFMTNVIFFQLLFKCIFNCRHTDFHPAELKNFNSKWQKVFGSEKSFYFTTFLTKFLIPGQKNRNEIF